MVLIKYILILFSLLLICCSNQKVAGGSGTEVESTIAGRVVVEDTPVEGASVYIRPENYLPGPDESSFEDTLTDAQGNFVLPVTDTGGFYIEVVKLIEGDSYSTLYKARVESLTDQIALGESTLELSENILGTVQLNLIPNQNLYIGVYGTRHVIQAVASVAFELRALPPGDYQVQVFTGEIQHGPPITSTTNSNMGVVEINPGMTFVPGGCYQMGSPDTDTSAQDREKPRHQVCIDGYYLDNYEVSQGDYQACVDGGVCPPPDNSAICDSLITLGPNYPAVCISWDDAKLYCEWVDKRLPHEAEWEMAARAGTQTTYFWGDDQSDMCTYALVNENSCNLGYPSMAPVTTFTPNTWGFYHMYGNAAEWIGDWYDAAYYSISPQDNPTGPATGIEKVFRGGRWNNLGIDARSAHRGQTLPANRLDWVGFRCADSSNQQPSN